MAGILKAVYENTANMPCRPMLSTPLLMTEACGLKRSDPGWLCLLCSALLLRDQWFWKGWLCACAEWWWSLWPV